MLYVAYVMLTAAPRDRRHCLGAGRLPKISDRPGQRLYPAPLPDMVNDHDAIP